MSAPVDVRAVLRSLMTDAAITRMYDHDAEAKHAAAENALAAVAELVEAARAAEYHLTREHRAPMTIDAADYLTEVQWDRDALRAALARVRGSK